jgi:hypothetical protein
MRFYFPVIFLFYASHAYAQTPGKIEQELLIAFRQIQARALYSDGATTPGRIDSIKQANTSFRNSLLAYTAASRATFAYEFKELEKEGLVIRTSEDGLFRIYSWDMGIGGTEHHFDAVFQYKAANEVFSRAARQEADDAGKWYSRIFDLKTETKTYYIGLYHEMFSTTDLFQGVKVFCIEDKNLNESVRLFKTTKGLTNEMGLAYNFLSVARRPERPAKLIYYDTDDDQLHLTVVSDDGKVTRQMITYQFNGEYFERITKRQ